jgi:hypothetical protein
MEQRAKKFGIAAILWALLLGTVVIVIGGGILLPSTKRARLDLVHQREAQEPSEAGATTAPARSSEPASAQAP